MRYKRKGKKQIVEAEQYTPDNEKNVFTLLGFEPQDFDDEMENDNAKITTKYSIKRFIIKDENPNLYVYVNKGDWVVKLPDGTFDAYTDVFLKIYEPVK